MNTSPRIVRYIAAVALAGSGVVATGGTPAEAAQSPAATLENLNELIASYQIDPVSGPYPSVGDTVHYVDYLETPDGHRVGTVYGYLNVIEKDPSTGHYIDFAAERIVLADGTIVDAGLFDLNEAFGHAWETLPAWGVCGAYAGEYGRRDFQIVKSGVSLNARIALSGR
ncbi:hypothetical protein ABH935_006057 [Catenulispora sp. GAS73]|uniref:allene oxide cyclase barrel-like domain-containing protein n=1 Tax=Catenulispora sp. GAS73 TaxID=3156269 RepID=UPI003514E13F